MTDDELDAIEARSADALRYGSHPSYLAGSASDVPALVAEVRRLQTDLSVHRSAVSELQNDVDDLMLRDKPETTLYRFHEWKRRAEAAEADVERLEVLCADLGNAGAEHAQRAEASETDERKLRRIVELCRGTCRHAQRDE